MRRLSVMLLLVATVLAGWLVAGRQAIEVVAQEGTPTAGDEMSPPGVTFAYLAGGPIAELPQRLGYMALVRVTLEPGATLPSDPNDPSFTLIYVESGSLTLSAEAALPIVLATPGTDFPPEQELPAGSVANIGPGGSFVGPPNTAGELRNDGTEPLVLLVALAVAAEDVAPPAGTPTS